MASKRARRVYSPAFKQEAVRRMQERRRAGASLAQVSRELEVRADLLRQWERAAGAPAARPALGELSDAEELRRVRRELETVRMERDFLKKAAAFFAKESR